MPRMIDEPLRQTRCGRPDQPPSPADRLLAGRVAPGLIRRGDDDRPEAAPQEVPSRLDADRQAWRSSRVGPSRRASSFAFRIRSPALRAGVLYGSGRRRRSPQPSRTSEIRCGGVLCCNAVS